MEVPQVTMRKEFRTVKVLSENSEIVIDPEKEVLYFRKIFYVNPGQQFSLQLDKEIFVNSYIKNFVVKFIFIQRSILHKGFYAYYEYMIFPLIKIIKQNEIEINQKVLYIFQLSKIIQEMHNKFLLHKNLTIDKIFIKEKQVYITSLYWMQINDETVQFVRFNKSYFLNASPEIFLYDNFELMNQIAFDIDWSCIDIWSLGCIIYEILYKQHPFANIKELENLIENQQKIKEKLQSKINIIKKNFVKKKNKKIHKNFKNFQYFKQKIFLLEICKRCFQFDFLKRIKIDQIVQKFESFLNKQKHLKIHK